MYLLYFFGKLPIDDNGIPDTCQTKRQKLLLVLLENARKVLKGRRGFRNAGKVLEMQERI